MTLAFIKAVKTMRMSGSPSPFTSHSSRGDNTPPATVTENHCTCQKGYPAHIPHWENRAGPEKTHGQPSLTEYAREPSMPCSSYHGKMFHCMERQKCSIWVRERKGKNAGANRKRFLLPTSLPEMTLEPHML